MNIIEPTIKPMLAKKFIDIKPNKLNFPYIAQRKYNGLRATSEFTTFKVNTGLFIESITSIILYSRGGNAYLVNNIIEALSKLTENPMYKDWMLDGELYIHNTPLNIIKRMVSMLLPNGTISETSIKGDVNFIVYDMYDKSRPTLSQKTRLELLKDMYELENLFDLCPNIILADYEIVHNIEEVYNLQNKYIEDGYEGIMLREMNGIYTPKRTSSLLKLKRILDTECLILDIIDDGYKSGRENIAFILRNDRNDETFKAIPGDMDNSWDNAYKRSVYENKADYIGKYATVSFYDRSGVKQVPFHANVKTIRDYE